jgi:hypothetical protein
MPVTNPNLSKKERRRLRKSLAITTLEYVAHSADVPDHVKKDVQNNLILFYSLCQKQTPATAINPVRP